MAKCVYKHRKDIIMCSSDFNKIISIQTRNIIAPTNFDDDVDYSEEFIAFHTFWAMVETVTGESIFDGSNIKRVITHRFYIRYIPGITFENWLDYSGKRYMIVDVENINEQNDYILLRCNTRGDASLSVNEQ